LLIRSLSSPVYIVLYTEPDPTEFHISYISIDDLSPRVPENNDGGLGDLLPSPRSEVGSREFHLHVLALALDEPWVGWPLFPFLFRPERAIFVPWV
jgi:hypothetical protein